MAELAELQQRSEWESSAQQVCAEVVSMRHSDGITGVLLVLGRELIRLGALDPADGERVSLCLFDLERDRVLTGAAVESPHTGGQDDDLSIIVEDVPRREWEKGDPQVTARSRGSDPGWGSLGGYTIAHVPFGHGAVSLTRRRRQAVDMALLQALAPAVSLGCLRYLDLLRVEQRNRQLTFGRAVERVRTEAADMQQSGDMGKVLAALYDGWRECGLHFELGTLNIVDHRSGVFRCYILAPDELAMDEGLGWRVVRRSVLPGLHLACSLDVPLTFAQDRNWAQPLHRATLWTIPETFADDMRVLWGAPMPDAEEWTGRAAINVPFRRGGLFAMAEEECAFTEEDVHIIEMFADVVSLGYSRFLDFQRLEDQASLQNRERAAERIRAEAMAMQQSDDLAKVATLVFWEIRGLGIDAITSSITFIDEAAGETLTYVASGSQHLEGIEADPSIWKHVDDRTVVGTWQRSVSQWRRDWISPEHDRLGPWREQVPLTVEEVVTPEMLQRLLNPLHETTELEGLPWLGTWQMTHLPFQHGLVAYRARETNDSQADDVQALAEGLSLGYLRFLDFRKVDEAQRELISDLERELQTAHDVLTSLMPSQAPAVQGFDIAGRCLPARHVGGDFFQYFHRPDETLSVTMADVTGHAMAAAMPVVMFDGMLRSQRNEAQSVEDLFGRLNHLLCEALDPYTFVCFCLAEIDADTRWLRLSTCGCPYPLLYRAASMEVEELEINAYPLGSKPGTTYVAREMQLEVGDSLVFYSDGIPESENPEGELFGFIRTATAVTEACSDLLPAEAIINHVMEEVEAFARGVPQADDMTCVVVRVAG